MTSCRIIETVESCREVTKTMELEPFIAVDSEGVNLSKTGPLTLLQMATARERVYLFDVMKEPRMIQEGGLKALLENSSIVKVLHSARNDGEALYWQHGVKLGAVHDTQLAHMELDRAEGRLFPVRHKLYDICRLYCPHKQHLLSADKDLMHTKLRKEDGEYWARRPLTPEMIHYAVHDVIALVPEVYKAQKALLEDHGVLESFQDRVHLELRSIWCSQTREQMAREDRELIQQTLQKYLASSGHAAGAACVSFDDIEDENVLGALSHVRLSDIGHLQCAEVILHLKLQQMNNRLQCLENEIEEKGDSFEPNVGVCGLLHAYIAWSRDASIIQRAKRLQAAIARIVLKDVQHKYTTTTPLSHVAEYEKKIVTSQLRPSGVNDPAVHPVLLRLFWEIRQEDLAASMAQYQKKPFAITEGFTQMLRYYALFDVPQQLKEQGAQFLRSLQEAGVVIPPASLQQ